MNDQTEEQILFPEAKIGNLVIKPWSFGILFEISTILETVLDKMDKKGLSLDDIDDFVSYSFMLKLFTIASPELLKIVSVTIDQDEEEVKKLSMQDGIATVIVIAKQNWTTIKNAVSPLLNKMMEEGEITPGIDETIMD